jgi:two-component system cell cycle response regulator DivK
MGKVIIAKDNKLNLKLSYDLLMIQQYDVVVFKDGINIMGTNTKEKPHLILMDIQLNEVSGIDLIKLLKQNSMAKYITIIAITAFKMKSDGVKISKSGCDIYQRQFQSIIFLARLINLLNLTNREI